MANFQNKLFSKDDEYMTPKSAWEDIEHLIPRTDENQLIYEAFYGDGKSGEYLEELGFNVIHEEIDFFDDDERPTYDILISNPPFQKVQEILKKLYELDKPFIIILPSSKINTQYFRIWKDKKIQIIIPKRRIQFIKNGRKGSCNFDCFYYCYKINLENDITWLD